MASATPKGGGGNSGASGSASSGGGASGPSAPTLPMLATFKTFYIFAPGGDLNFSSYVTEIAARYIGDDFAKPPAASVGVPLFFVAAPSWTEDTFTAACQSDPNVVGGRARSRTRGV